MDPLLLLGGKGLPVSAMRSEICQVAQIGYRMAELVATVVLLLVAVPVLGHIVSAVLDDVGIFRLLGLYVVHEGLLDLELGQHMPAVYVVAFHLAEHLQRIRDHLRMIREQGGHLLLALEVFLLRVAQPPGIVDIGIGGEADQPVVYRAVLLAHEMHVVGRHYLHAVLLSETEYLGAVFLLVVVHLGREPGNLRPVQHHLEVVVVSEYPLVPFYGLVHALRIAREYELGNLAGHAGRAADEVLVIFLQHLVAYPRTVVHTLDIAYRHYLHQVPVAVIVLGEQYQVVVFLVVVVLQAVVVVPRHIDFAAYYGLDVRELLRDVEKVLHAVHVAVVGDGETGHSEFRGALEKLLDVAQSV